MDTNSYPITIMWEISSANDDWRSAMDDGVPAPEVTGDIVHLPQGGTRKSKAAITGGIFTEGSEAAGHAEENSKKIISSVLPEEVQSRIMDLLNGGSISDIEFFVTNIAKNEYMKIANEFKDNPDEEKATDMVINSLHVSVSVTGLPSMEEVINDAKLSIVEEVRSMLGGDAS